MTIEQFNEAKEREQRIAKLEDLARETKTGNIIVTLIGRNGNGVYVEMAQEIRKMDFAVEYLADCKACIAAELETRVRNERLAFDELLKK